MKTLVWIGLALLAVFALKAIKDAAGAATDLANEPFNILHDVAGFGRDLIFGVGDPGFDPDQVHTRDVVNQVIRDNLDDFERLVRDNPGMFE